MASSIPVTIKHAGKVYPFNLDISQTVPEFREALYNITGVAPPQQKVLIKGQLKDGMDLKKLGIKEGQSITLIGTAGEIPKAPVMQTKFIEDMDESELAQAFKIPVGLQNLGNTCYMNSTIQVLRQIPELTQSLTVYTDGLNSMNPDRRLVASLRDLYTGMDKAATEYPPLIFWQMLRTCRPQFDQQDNHGHFAQQDAEECWSSVVAALKGSLGDNFVEQYMSGKLLTTTKSLEAPDEEPTVREESFLNLTCSINANTNYLTTGLNEGFTQQIEKNSPTLGRNAIYTSTSTITRAPTYLAVHLNRFFWRPDIRKKTKIMRRVKFPFELDATELMSDSLKGKVKNLNARVKEVEKDRLERMRVAKRTKRDNNQEVDDWMTDEERKKRAEEAEEMEKLIDPDLKADTGACSSGMYDLQAILTHKGSDANSGHYMAYCRNPNKAESWFKFDDAKVTEIKEEAIVPLEGGGEGPIAYLLLYRAKELK